MRTQFDHERLDVYRVLVQFNAWASALIEETKLEHGSKVTAVCDHLDRAALSAVLNTAEGNGKWHPKLRAKFLADARGSATECAACLDILVAKQCCTDARIDDGKEMLLRIVAMHSRMIAMFSKAVGVGEDETPYGCEGTVLNGIEHEHEHEQEHE